MKYMIISFKKFAERYQPKYKEKTIIVTNFKYFMEFSVVGVGGIALLKGYGALY
jgi:hypothetical protein